MIRFEIAPAWHWSLVTVSLLAVFALIIWSYPRRLRDLSPGAARLLLLLRLWWRWFVGPRTPRSRAARLGLGRAAAKNSLQNTADALGRFLQQPIDARYR